MLVDFQAANPRFERRRGNSETHCRTVRPRNAPASFAKNALDPGFVVVAISSSFDASSTAERSRRKPKHVAVSEDHTAFDHVLKFADVAGPRIFLHCLQRSPVDVTDL